MRLADYPFILVRISCEKCRREGSYKLARLAEAYGAGIELDELAEILTRDCARRNDERTRFKRNAGPACFAEFPDLRIPRPPDLPPAIGALRVIEGGRRKAG